MTRPKLLIVEDDEPVRTQLKYALRDDFTLFFAEDRAAALSVVRREHPPLVSLDLGLPPSRDSAEAGLAALDQIMRTAPDTKVVVLTGNGDRENAVRAVQLGAFDYQQKPIQLEDLRVVLRRAAYLRTLEAEADTQRQAGAATARFHHILGSTPAMREIFSVVTRVARTDVTVLIQGESGTGKELLARAIHANSTRRDRPFVAINCGAIPDTLLESELFGHEKGAYTGAHVQRRGKLELADGGTLFLDEVGEMSAPLQVKLLRFLQQREIERVGGREVLRLDARVIAATNKDVKAELQAGRFREDLYYRLSVMSLSLPPLRDRAEDIALIATTLLARSCAEHRRKLRFSSAALEALSLYAWPGNVRELENVVERAVLMAGGKVIDTQDLGIEVKGRPRLASLREARNRAERHAVVDALVRTRGNITRSAKLLAVSRPTLHGLLARFGINARSFR
jgi:two-component system, NtrC family, response regulator